MGVGGDELGVEDTGGGVDDGVIAGEAVVERGVGGGEGDGFVERHDTAQQRLGGKAVGEGAAAMLGKVAIDLEDDNRRDDDRGFPFEVMPEGCCLGIFG